MQLMTIDGGLYQILNMHSDESTMTYTLWPVDERPVLTTRQEACGAIESTSGAGIADLTKGA